MKNTHHTVLLSVSGLNISTATGRPLIKDLNLTIGYEQVALLGRNGVGKSTLIESLTQLTDAQSTSRYYVAQNLEILNSGLSNRQIMTNLYYDMEPFLWKVKNEFTAIGLRPYQELVAENGFSRGELRKIVLVAAKLSKPQLLLLDEPSEDLDETGILWLQAWLRQWTNGLIIVSHERSILALFAQFLIMSESGCRSFQGSFTALQKNLKQQDGYNDNKYLRYLNSLQKQEQRNETILQRRLQKKNQGRWRELGRMVPKSRLNQKRGYAQQSQARVAKIRLQRIQSDREFVLTTRRKLAVSLAMKMTIPQLPQYDGKAIVQLKNITHTVAGRTLFQNINLTMGRERLAITGPNAAGKTTLLKIILQQQTATQGRSHVHTSKIASIAQGATNWMVDISLVMQLLITLDACTEFDLTEKLSGLVTAILNQHKFPLALAQRPLKSLSPGERLRAAFICILAHTGIECLVLDEPTYSLDFVGMAAIIEGLKAWRGGLIVVSHDAEFLRDIGITRYLQLDGQAGHELMVL